MSIIFKSSIALAALAMIAGTATAQDLTLDVQQDQWNYPFNASPGTRTNGGLFATDYPNGGQFHYHDPALIFQFGPSGTPEYTTGKTPAEYDFSAVTVTLTHSPASDIGAAVFTWDLSSDFGPTYFGAPVPMHINIHGVGTVSLDLSTWTENQSYIGTTPAPFDPPRDPFPLHIDDMATTPSVIDVASPTSWGTVDVSAYTPGVTTSAFPVTFTLDVSNPRVKSYIQEGLASGRLFFTVISNADSGGMGSDGSTYPRFELNGGSGPGSNPEAATITFEDFTDSAITAVEDWAIYN